MNTELPNDPVLVRRAQVAKLVDLGQKVGYSLFGVAIVAFIVTRVGKPTPLLTSIVAWTMGIGSLILAPAIVFGYAVKAAEREDRKQAAEKQLRREAAAANQAAQTEQAADRPGESPS